MSCHNPPYIVCECRLVQETSPSGRARQRFEAASQHEEREDGAREAWEAELMQALKDEREVSHASPMFALSTKLVQNCCRSRRFGNR